MGCQGVLHSCAQSCQFLAVTLQSLKDLGAVVVVLSWCPPASSLPLTATRLPNVVLGSGGRLPLAARRSYCDSTKCCGWCLPLLPPLIAAGGLPVPRT